MLLSKQTIKTIEKEIANQEKFKKMLVAQGEDYSTDYSKEIAQCEEIIKFAKKVLNDVKAK